MDNSISQNNNSPKNPNIQVRFEPLVPDKTYSIWDDGHYCPFRVTKLITMMQFRRQFFSFKNLGLVELHNLFTHHPNFLTVSHLDSEPIESVAAVDVGFIFELDDLKRMFSKRFMYEGEYDFDEDSPL